MAVVEGMKCGRFADALAGPCVSLLCWWLGCLLLGLAYLLPFQSGPWLMFHKEMLAAAGAAFWLLAVRPLAVHRFSVFLLALCLVVIIQYVAGLVTFFEDAFFSVAWLLMLALAFEVGAGLRQDGESAVVGEKRAVFLSAFWWLLLVSALLSALVAVHQWLGTTFPEFEFTYLAKRRPIANLAQPNHLASLLLLGVCALLFFQVRRTFSGWLGGILVSFLLFTLALTQSRAAWLYVGVGCCFMQWEIRRGRLRLPGWLPAFLLVFLLLAVLVSGWANQSLALAQADVAERVTNTGRLGIWKGMLAAIAAGPWHGYGWMQVTHAALASPADEMGGIFDFSHNLLLDLLVWMGPWPGGATIFVAAVWLWRKFHRRNSAEDTVYWLAVGVLLNHSMFEFPFAYTWFLLPAGLLLGWVAGGQETETLVFSGEWRWAWPLGVVGSFLLGLAVLVAEYATISDGAFNDRMRAAGLVDFPVVELGDVKLLDGLAAQQESCRLPVGEALSAGELRLLEQVAERYPLLPNLQRLDAAYQIANRTADACRVDDWIHKFYGGAAVQGCH